jgi:hypothetical protein
MSKQKRLKELQQYLWQNGSTLENIDDYVEHKLREQRISYFVFYIIVAIVFSILIIYKR